MQIGSQPIQLPYVGKRYELINEGASAIFYGGQYVSSANNSGEVPAGQTAILEGQYYVATAAGVAPTNVELVPATATSGPKTVTINLGGHGAIEGTEAASEFIWRVPITLPVSTLRWRLRIRNYNSCQGGETPGAGASTVKSVYKGVPKANAGRWKGAFRAAPTQVLGEFPVGTAADSVSPWVSDPKQQFSAYTLSALSLGISKAFGKWFFDEFSGPLWSQAGAAAKAGETGEPSGVGGLFTYSAYDMRIEYEYLPSPGLGNLVGLVIGDSIASGYPLTDGGPYPAIESWPAIAGLRQGHPVMFSGPAGCRSDAFNSLASFRWTRLNIGTTIPDYAIIAFGVNDTGVFSLVEYENNMTALIKKLQEEVGIPSIYLATATPCKLSAPRETKRGEFNTWIRTNPVNIAGVVELDKQIAMQAKPEEIDPVFGVAIESNPHVLRSAYQRMAGALILP